MNGEEFVFQKRGDDPPFLLEGGGVYENVEKDKREAKKNRPC